LLGLFESNQFILYFDKARLIEFTKFYPCELYIIHLVMLDNQLETYIIDMHCNLEFSSLIEILNIFEKLIETRRHILSISLPYFEVSNDFARSHNNHGKRLFCHEKCEK